MKNQIAAVAVVVFVLAAWGASHAGLLAQTASPQPTPAPSPSPGPRSVRDGVFSEDQAKRGASIYSGVCSQCHGEKLKGNEAIPALSGSDFDTDWEGQTLDDIFRKIRRSMPKNQPERLSQQQKIDVMAYILSFNKFPSGKTDLPPDNELLKLIRYQSANPDAKKGN
jgi:S-disulfanyl-L-cysteine oxidoreductase SoxD